MQKADLETIASELKNLYVEDCRTPFPYAGARRLLQEAGGGYEDLIPDLDLYFSTIAGYCSWGKTILNWPRAKVDEARKRVSDSFFNRHPKYKALEKVINESVAPDLYAELRLHEEMRAKLLELLFQLTIDKWGRRG
jgi:hypothetical protein